MPDHIEINSLNKPILFQVKRVLRAIKKMENQDKPQKQGAFLQAIRKAPGSAVANEKIVHDIFGKEQVLSPNDFKKRIYEYEIEPGAKFYVSPETAFQTTQRLIPNEKKNRTISTSIYSEIYEKILDKFRDRPDGDNIIRKINRNLAAHFSDSAAFIRFTHMSPRWIHIDAYQTDFFSKLKYLQFHEPEMKEVVDEFRKHEFEFFKAAFSYILRTNPNVKLWTSNTEDVARRIENVRGEVKLKEYYYKLPKDLGFKLIPIERLYKILGNRPPKMVKLYSVVKPTEVSLKKVKGREEITRITGTKPGVDKPTETFKKALGKNKGVVEEDLDGSFSEILLNIGNLIKQKVASKSEINQSTLDEIFNDSIPSDWESKPHFVSALHQEIEGVIKAVEEAKIKKLSVTNAVKKYLTSRKEAIVKFVREKMDSGGEEGQQIWWADRRMLFENSKENFADSLLEFKNEMVK